MGQKVNPIGFRIGFNRECASKWYSKKNYKDFLVEDLKIRKFFNKNLNNPYVEKLVIERSGAIPKIAIYTSRPAVIIGKKGSDIEKLNANLKKHLGKEVQINWHDVRKPDLFASLLAQNVAQQLEKRVSFRRAMKRAVQNAMREGAQGIRINCAGRLGGAEIARTEWYRGGRVPLHTLRADIDYARAEALTTYGIIGIKVWVCKGEKFGD